MGAIMVVLLLALVLAAVIMLYVAYPYRGEQTPVTPLLGEAMRRGVASLPTLDPQAGDGPVALPLSEPVREAPVEAHR
jgi:hypothetical protein